MDQNDVEIIARETAYQGYTRVERLVLRHRLFAGGWSAPVRREVIDRGHAAAVLPYDPRRDEVVLIEQFRPGALVVGAAPWLVEVVAGILEPDESPEALVRREALEEAGCAITALEPIASCLVSPGIFTESVVMFCGRCDAASAGGIHGIAAEGEDIRAFVASYKEAMRMLADGTITNAIALIALQWLALNRDRLRKAWV
jgi:ADP-ribose pyrophosphatase